MMDEENEERDIDSIENPQKTFGQYVRSNII